MKFKEWKHAKLACDIAQEYGVIFDREKVMESELDGSAIASSENLMNLCTWSKCGLAGEMIVSSSATIYRLYRVDPCMRISSYPRKSSNPLSIASKLRMTASLISFDRWYANRVKISYIGVWLASIILFGYVIFFGAR